MMLTVAHPDDETFGCGSVLAHASASGVETLVVCATRGELGEPQIDIGDTPLAEIREAELRAAAAMLGVASVEVLDWLDSGVHGEPACGSLAAAATADVAAAIRTLIERWQPDVVITPEGSDGHRDHIAVRDATLLALAASEWQPGRTYLWCLTRSLLSEYAGVELGTPDESITTIVDATAYLDLRRTAMRAHASQASPYDAMSPDLQHAFLSRDFLIRLDPPPTDDTIEHDWVPQTIGRSS
jgi:N-acetyl-1-D-myo-inositol-2-amino-2-deoxy-alpha-D-glucopyranoside deacetylase